MNARNRFPIRGGNWNNGANAGVAALNLNNERTNANSNIGFRPALDNARSSDLKGCCQCKFEKDAPTSAIAETHIAPLDASGSCIFESIFDFENILRSAYQCRKGKAKSKSALIFFDNLEENVISIQNDLIWDSYKPSPYRHFYVFEPKRRLISAPHFRDRVVHRAIYNILEPMFDRRYMYDSYACRKGKGAHKGADRVQMFIRDVERDNGKAYALKADVKHYFSSINHDILKSILRKKLRCNRTIILLEKIIDSSPSDISGVGIPLGNLTSQLFANVYLHELDFYMKHTLRIKRTVRYMDDICVIHHDKSQLHQWRDDIEQFLSKRLGLVTNSKTQVFPISKTNGRALDFLGFRIYGTHRLLRKSSIKRIKTKLRKYRKMFADGSLSLSDIDANIQSWIGHASHANTEGLKRSLFSKPFKRG